MHKRVLVAEDHPGIRRLVVRYVTKAGYVCIPVTNGKEAVEAFEAESFDLIIMDGSMPVMDGFTATKRIRALEESLENGQKRIPIILHSALPEPEARERCLKCGIDEFLSKSSSKTLMVVVNRYLEAGRPRNVMFSNGDLTFRPKETK